MRLSLSQLPNSLSLEKHHRPVYLIAGDEPLQCDEARSVIVSALLKNHTGERICIHIESDNDWQTVAEQARGRSLFSTRRVVDVRLSSKITIAGRKWFAAYCGAPFPDLFLILSVPKLDQKEQRAPWFSALDRLGVWVMARSVTAEQLPAWLIDRAKVLGKTLSHEASLFMADRLEGNLFAARQELEKCFLLIDHDTISLEDVAAAVGDSARYSVFDMLEAALQGRAKRTVRMVMGLECEAVNPMAVYGALMWELRRTYAIARALAAGMNAPEVYRRYRLWQNRQAAIKSVIDRHSLDELERLLLYAGRLDRLIKTGGGQFFWDGLLQVLLYLAGKPITSSPSVLLDIQTSRA